MCACVCVKEPLIANFLFESTTLDLLFSVNSIWQKNTVKYKEI